MSLATRLGHEAHFHEHVWFVSLNYDPEHLPYGGSLLVKHQSQFIKSLRRSISRRKNRPKPKIKFFSIGEYGGEAGRAHYHFIIFGMDFPDRKKLYSKPEQKHYSPDFIRMFGQPSLQYYTDEELTKIWGKGKVILTPATEATMQYVAKYHIEKINGEYADEAYQTIVESTGEEIRVEAPQARMSNGIGLKWIETYWQDIYPRGYCQGPGGVRFKPPEYYERWLEINQPEVYEEVKKSRENLTDFEGELEQRREAINSVRKAELFKDKVGGL